MSHSRKHHAIQPPLYKNKPNYAKESFFEIKKASLKKTEHIKPAYNKAADKKTQHKKARYNSHSELTLSSRITLVTFTILLLAAAAAAAAEREKITFSHVTNSGRDVKAEIGPTEVRYLLPQRKPGDQHVVKMQLGSNTSKLSAHCLRTSELGCRIDGADQGHTMGLRSTHYASINPNLDHDGLYPHGPLPDLTVYAVTHHYQCSGKGDLSTFDVIDASSRTNFMLTDAPGGKDLIIQHGNHNVLKEPSSALFTPHGSIRAFITERSDPKTADVDRSVTLTMKENYMSVDVSVQHIKENEEVRIHAKHQRTSITVQASTLQGHELKFPPLKAVHGCRSSEPPTQSQQASKHMQLFYTPKRETTEVEFISDTGVTKATYLKK